MIVEKDLMLNIFRLEIVKVFFVLKENISDKMLVNYIGGKYFYYEVFLI